MIPPTIPTLYNVRWYPGAVIQQILHELSIPDTTVAVKIITEEDMRTGDHFVKLSPRRLIPVMHLPDGTVIHETAAIAMYILETYDKQGILHPHVGEPMRGKFLQGMFYAAAEAFPVCSAHFNLVMKEKCTDEKTVKESKDKVATVIHAHLKREVEAHKGEFYLGDKFTAVDLMFSYVLMCLEYCQGMMDDNEVVANYFKTLKCRESYAPFYTPTEEEMACCTASHEHEEKQNGAH